MCRLRVGWCSLLVGSLTLGGCATREIVVDAPTQRTWVEAGTPSNYFASTSAAKDELSFQLQATSCTNTEVTQLISDAREEKKSSFIAGPGLMIGGALAGATSIPVFASANENPETCAEDDTECVSKEDALATGYLLAGLGAAGLVVGAYNTFKEPVVLRSWQEEAGAPNRIANDCTLPTQTIPVELLIDDQVIVSGTTDSNGWVTWTAPDHVVGTLSPVSAALRVSTQPPQVVPVDLSVAIQQASRREFEALMARVDERVEQGEYPEEAAPAAPQAPTSWLDQIQYDIWVWLRDHQPECQGVVRTGIELGSLWVGGKINAKIAEGILLVLAVEHPWLRTLVEEFTEDAVVMVLNQFAPQLFKDFLDALTALQAYSAEAVCAVARDVIRPTP